MVPTLLTKRHAVVLERLACGGGATRWYFCSDSKALDAIRGELSPGSVVSFYFDDRIRRVTLSPLVRSEIEQISTRDGDAVVGALEDEVHLRVDFVSGPGSLDEFVATLAPDTALFAGAFPARDNDNVSAVTVTLPDGDGVVRPHPH